MAVYSYWSVVFLPVVWVVLLVLFGSLLTFTPILEPRRNILQERCSTLVRSGAFVAECGV